MIQFNLLPDVKIEYIKTRRTKRLVSLVSLAVSAVSVFVLLLSMLTVYVVQKKSLNDLDKDINTNSQQLKSLPNLDKVLTVQNQLNTLTGLHDQKAVSSRLFDYVAQLTPNGVTISSLSTDFTQNTMNFTGAAPSLDQVNQFVDTLKATKYVTYTPDDAGQQQMASDQAYYQAHGSYPVGAKTVQAFSNVVLTTFGKNDKGASYSVDLSCDPLIFSNANLVALHVPQSTVTNTSVLFQKAGN